MLTIREKSFVDNSNQLSQVKGPLLPQNSDKLNKDALIAAVSKNQLPRDVDGNMCAYKLSEIKAKNHQKLNPEDLSVWDDFITGKKHKLSAEVTKKLNSYLDSLDTDLQKTTSIPMTSIELCEFLAKSYINFLSIHPFEEGSSLRIGRIILNYALNWMQKPIIVFNIDEKQELEHAAKNDIEMRLYFAKKIKEAINQDNTTFELKTDYGPSKRYIDPQTQKEIIVEWHRLIAKEKEWTQSLGISKK